MAESTDPLPPLAIARPRGTYLAFAVAGLGLTGAAVVLVVTHEGLTIVAAVVLACAAGLTLGVISTVYGALARGPSLTVSDEGIVDRTSLFGVGLVRWDEIAGLATFRYWTQHYLLIFLNDPTTFAAQLAPLPGVVVRINKVLSPAPICIPAVWLPGLDAVLAQTQERYAHQLATHGIRVIRVRR
jgi:hypothetical protein